MTRSSVELDSTRRVLMLQTVPRVRKMDFPFADSEIPRFWMYGNPVLTHLANGINLLFPLGEQFFIRSVKYYLDDIEDPALKARVKGFFGQEGRHGHEHERFNEVLRTQGVDVDRFLRVYRRIAYETIEHRVPPILRLSTTVALEHFTASLAVNALANGFLDGAHPTMAALLRWHAAEEIEHKSVAFDVLKAVDPRYSVRMIGLAIATSQLLGWWAIAAAMLIAQEDAPPEEKERWKHEAKRLQMANVVEGRYQVFKRAILEYVRPDFHPDQNDDYHLARDYLASVGAAV
jgi:predicted metal-dependent hydrolase